MVGFRVFGTHTHCTSQPTCLTSDASTVAVTNKRMPDLSSLLAKIPDDLKPLVALGIGAVMLVFLVMFHGAGLHLILVLRKRRERRLRLERLHLVAAFLLFGWSVFLLLHTAYR